MKKKAAVEDSSEVGIYKRNQESKKTRKQEFDQEIDQEKLKCFLFFLVSFLVDFMFFLLLS